MSFYKDEGIILKRVNIGEADRIITFYTKNNGKIQAKARGVRKPLSRLAGSLELFNCDQLIFFQGKSIDRVTSAEVILSFKRIREDLQKMSAAYLISEIVDKLTGIKDKNCRLCKLLIDTFKELDELLSNESQMTLLLDNFKIQLVSLLGYSPQLHECVQCERKIEPKINYFSAKLGGILCSRCLQYDKKAQKIRLNPIKVLRIMQDQGFGKIKKMKLKSDLIYQVNNITKNFLESILEKELKSERFMKEIKKY